MESFFRFLKAFWKNSRLAIAYSLLPLTRLIVALKRQPDSSKCLLILIRALASLASLAAILYAPRVVLEPHFLLTRYREAPCPLRALVYLNVLLNLNSKWIAHGTLDDKLGSFCLRLLQVISEASAVPCLTAGEIAEFCERLRKPKSMCRSITRCYCLNYWQ